ncbi:MAG: isocitrate lyase [Thermoplasmatota archaeon]
MTTKQHLEILGLDPKTEIAKQAADMERDWKTNPRWQGVKRDYTALDVVRLRGSVPVEHTLARHGAERLWHLLKTEEYLGALGCVTGMQAVQAVKAGLKAVYLSGWQTAADNNLASQTYPDQSLYPANSVPDVVRRINNALLRADEIEWAEQRHTHYWMAPIMADAEAGFGGPLNAFELMKGMIDAGAAGVHWEDQLASEKKCGHMGGKVLIPTSQHVRTLTAARLAADVAGAPTMIVARTDSLGATLLTSDIDARDHPFCTGERTAEGYFFVKPSIDSSIARCLAYAPYADMLWFESSHPDVDEARVFADAIHAKFPGKPLMYNCSPSFNWKKRLDDGAISKFHKTLAEMGYKFQFITLAGFHSLNAGMFELAKEYAEGGMPAYVRLQEHEFALEKRGYSATKHQREVGTGYFDEVSQVISGGTSSTLALKGSTEEEQFTDGKHGNGKKPK